MDGSVSEEAWYDLVCVRSSVNRYYPYISPTSRTHIANRHAAPSAEKNPQVTHLENLKRKCLKAGKKVASASASTGPTNTATNTGRGGRGGRKGSGFGGMLRRGSWTTGGKGKKGSSTPNEGGGSPLGSPGRVGFAVEGDGDGDGEDEAAVEEVEGVEVRMHPSLSSFCLLLIFLLPP